MESKFEMTDIIVSTDIKQLFYEEEEPKLSEQAKKS